MNKLLIDEVLMSWNPTQYLKFKSARIRPAIDLLQKSAPLFQSPQQVKNILDLGCGPGNVTPYIAHTFPNAKIVGIDSSAEMIENAIKANRDIADRVSFRVGTIEDEAEMKDKPYDLVYCNAALHWCVNHDILLPKILHNLVSTNGGVLAIQMPDTKEQKSHVLMEMAAFRCGLIDEIQHIRIPRADQSAAWYFNLLYPFCKEMDIWSTEYMQQLTTHEKAFSNNFSSTHAKHPVLEFTKATGLLPIIQALGGENHPNCKRYLQEYNRLLEEEYPSTNVKNKFHLQGKGLTLMPMKLLFFLCKT